MTLAERVKKRREELGLSQEELAIAMGYSSRTSINKIENGRPCTQKIIARLSEAMNVSVAYLMGWDEPEEELPPLTDKQKELYTKLCTLSDEECEAWIKLLGGK